MKVYIDPDEVFRYIAAKPLSSDSKWKLQVEEAIAQTEAQISPRFCYRFFSFCAQENGVVLEKTALFLPGQNIKQHLKKSDGCVLLAATLGVEMDFLLRQVSTVNMTRGLLLDACADAAIESLCDLACKEILNKLPCGKKLTNRYSPGYGDLPLSVQKTFLQTIDAQRKIGLHVSDASILTPRKSVTAILGITESDKKDIHKCSNCLKRSDCIYSLCGKE